MWRWWVMAFCNNKGCIRFSKINDSDGSDGDGNGGNDGSNRGRDLGQWL